MRIHELSVEDCRAVLERSTLARLACCRANRPYIVPVSLAYDRRSHALFGASGAGRKITWMRRNPNICLEVDEIEDRFHWTTLVINGRYEEIPPTFEQRNVRQDALELFKERTEWWLPALGKVGAREQESLIVYRVIIEDMTGRRAARG